MNRRSVHSRPSRRVTPRLRFVALAMGVGSVLLGCARTTIESPLRTNTTPGDVDAELDFWDALTTRLSVCNDEGFHGLILYTEGQDRTGSYEGRVDLAKRRGWISSSWNEPPNLAMQRGVVAQAVVAHCKIKGGVIMRTMGPSPRYATRELQYLGIMGAGTEQQTVSGREFMGIINKAQDYVAARAQVRPTDAAPSNPRSE